LPWSSPRVDRLGRDRRPSIPGHELGRVVTALSSQDDGAVGGTLGIRKRDLQCAIDRAYHLETNTPESHSLKTMFVDFDNDSLEDVGGVIIRTHFVYQTIPSAFTSL
jgi:hypothetical protein